MRLLSIVFFVLVAFAAATVDAFSELENNYLIATILGVLGLLEKAAEELGNEDIASYFEYVNGTIVDKLVGEGITLTEYATELKQFVESASRDDETFTTVVSELAETWPNPLVNVTTYAPAESWYVIDSFLSETTAQLTNDEVDKNLATMQSNMEVYLARGQPKQMQQMLSQFWGLAEFYVPGFRVEYVDIVNAEMGTFIKDVTEVFASVRSPAQVSNEGQSNTNSTKKPTPKPVPFEIVPAPSSSSSPGARTITAVLVGVVVATTAAALC